HAATPPLTQGEADCLYASLLNIHIQRKNDNIPKLPCVRGAVGRAQRERLKGRKKQAKHGEIAPKAHACGLSAKRSEND
ncbi:MAG: hypothetical protein J5890_05020, partial [Clostridia bacterium]|nr:hypothetical protein [Clostridia bacterium]